MRFHGTGVRGATMPRTSLLFEGPFGRIFRALPPADYGPVHRDAPEALAALARAMEGNASIKDGPDDEESAIPAAYTYFGQFIDHDLTFDPASSLQRQNDPQALVDYRTPRFDLDSVYGRGPVDQPYLYDDDGKTFLLGRKLTGGDKHARDLARSAAARAIIGDPRNDANVLVSQLHCLVLRFHNRVVAQHKHWDFEAVQRFVRFHYQWVVLHDFLPTIVHKSVLERIVPHLFDDTDPVKSPPRLRFYHARDSVFMPLEFSAAAYRFGHAMVRPGYRLNDFVGPLAVFDGNSNSNGALTGFREFPATWGLDWARFIDIERRPFGREHGKSDPDGTNARRLQLAYRIDTSLVEPLAKLPDSVVGSSATALEHRLAYRNLIRGWRMRLPNGQSVARAMGVDVLDDDRIKIGAFEDGAKDRLPDIVSIDKHFADNCPLWVYVLAETIKDKVRVPVSDGNREISTRLLGDVGGTIVAETMVGLLSNDSNSFLSLDPKWKPSLAKHGAFGLREFVAYAIDD